MLYVFLFLFYSYFFLRFFSLPLPSARGELSKMDNDMQRAATFLLHHGVSREIWRRLFGRGDRGLWDRDGETGDVTDVTW